jgi:hypothetical protein
MNKFLLGVLGFFLLSGPIAAWCGERVVIIDDFERGLLPRWEQKVFKGKTLYTVVPDGERKVLRAESRAAASGLVFKKKYELKDYPILAWRWKVSNVLVKGDARTKAGDDYAARVYVIFPHWFPPKTRSINYIWANRLPAGEFIPNSHYGNAVMLAVESGSEKVGQWVAERRDVLADFRKLFGEEPPTAGAIAIMTDTDNTGESVVAYYDDLSLASQNE